MAAICDMAKGRLADCRYFLGIVHGGIKTGFVRKKEASSCVQMVFTVCCLLLTAPNKGKITVSRTLAMVSSECVSRYCDIFTTETKELSFFHQLGR